MKKQLEIELKELAQKILNINSDTDITLLKQHAAKLYEHLCVLAYSRNNNNQESIVIPEEKEATIPLSSKAPLVTLEQSDTKIETFSETIIKLEELVSTEEKTDSETNIPNENSPDLLFELEELTAGFKNMPEFEPATPTEIENPISKINETISKPKSSLNESLKKGINIGLNDRLAFVKHLFDNNQGDYTRVISQLNTLESSSRAKNFIEQMVKPEYNNWEGKEAYEERFISAVFTKFDA